MYLQLINPGTDAETMFITVTNTYSTAALTVGQCVVFDYTTDCNGYSVTQPTTALLGAVAGLVASPSIAVGGIGLVQIYGHHAAASVTGATDITKGHPLTAVDSSFVLAMATLTGVNALNATCKPFFIAGEAYTTAATASKKVFVRAL